MKRIFAIGLLLMYSCHMIAPKSKQSKAEELAKRYLDSVLNDPHSYESVKFDTLKPEYKDYERADPEGKRLDSLAASFIDTSSMYKKQADNELYKVSSPDFRKMERYSKLDTLYYKKSDSIEDIIKKKKVGFKGPLENYILIHTYRAKNGFGALGLHTTRFQIDSALTKVLFAEEIHD